MIHSIFFAYFSGTSSFFGNLTTSFLWLSARSYILYFIINALSPYLSCPFLKCAHTILTCVTVPLKM